MTRPQTMTFFVNEVSSVHSESQIKHKIVGKMFVIDCQKLSPYVLLLYKKNPTSKA